jgi:hypothetical protein
MTHVDGHMDLQVRKLAIMSPIARDIDMIWEIDVPDVRAIMVLQSTR